jgi:hypothetical protein
VCVTKRFYAGASCSVPVKVRRPPVFLFAGVVVRALNRLTMLLVFLVRGNSLNISWDAASQFLRDASFVNEVKAEKCFDCSGLLFGAESSPWFLN